MLNLLSWYPLNIHFNFKNGRLSVGWQEKSRSDQKKYCFFFTISTHPFKKIGSHPRFPQRWQAIDGGIQPHISKDLMEILRSPLRWLGGNPQKMWETWGNLWKFVWSLQFFSHVFDSFQTFLRCLSYFSDMFFHFVLLALLGGWKKSLWTHTSNAHFFQGCGSKPDHAFSLGRWPHSLMWNLWFDKHCLRFGGRNC